jgi:hypothetical protein
MKKLLLVLVGLAIAGSTAFADITWSGGGRLVLVPFGIRLANDDLPDGQPGKEVATYFGSENPWSDEGVRLGLTVVGSRPEGNMGFKIAFDVEGTQIPHIDDNTANLWLKPFGGIFETFTMTFGIFNVDNLRYKFAGAGSSFHNYIWYVRGDLGDEEATFGRFASNGFGSHFAWEPVKGWWLGWGLGSVGDTRSFKGEFKVDGWKNVILSSQFGTGYTIENVGMLRAQVLGAKPYDFGEIKTKVNDTEEKYWGDGVLAIDKPLTKILNETRIQAAFNLNGIKGLNLDVGINYPLPYERDYYKEEAKTTKYKTVKTQADIQAGLGFDLTMFAPFRLWGALTLKTGGYTETSGAIAESLIQNGKVNNGTDIAIHLTPMFTVVENNIVGLDLFLDTRSGSDEGANQGAQKPDNDPTLNPDSGAKNNYTDLGFGVFYRRNIAGGDIRVAVTAKLPGGEAHKGAQPQFFVPIMFNYNF